MAMRHGGSGSVGARRRLRAVPALLGVVVALALAVPGAVAAPTTNPSVTIYPVPPAARSVDGLADLAPGPGGVWFTDDLNNELWRLAPDGTFSPQAVPGGVAGGVPHVLAGASDGALWYLSRSGNIGRLAPGGEAKIVYKRSSQYGSAGLAAGRDGSVWIGDRVQSSAPPGLIRVEPDGTTTTYGPFAGSDPTFDRYFDPWALALGPDGAMWSTDLRQPLVLRLGADGSASEFAAPPLEAITSGPASSLWGLGGEGDIYAIGTNGQVTTYALGKNPSYPSGYSDLTAGPDDGVWFSLAAGGSWRYPLGRLDPSGAVSYYDVPGYDGHPAGMTSADGYIWILGGTNDIVYRIDPTASPSACTRTATSGAPPPQRLSAEPFKPESVLKLSAEAAKTGLEANDYYGAAVKLALLLTPGAGEVEALVETSDLLSMVDGFGLGMIAKDPPERDYTRIAKPQVPSLPPLHAGGGLSAAAAGAGNSLLASEGRSAAYEVAYILSVQRAEGAAAARAGTWVTRQNTLAARYARGLAGALTAQVRARRAVARALRGTPLGRLRPTRGQLAAARHAIARRRLPTGATRLLRRLGVPQSEISAAATRPPALPRSAMRLADSIAPPALTESLSRTGSESAGFASLAQCLAGAH